MERAGMVLLQDLTRSAAIGPFDAARHLGRLRQARRLFDEHLKTKRPDLVVLVDFGDFNLPFIAPLAKRAGIPVCYFISPQLWAWGKWRMRLVKRYVDEMIVLFKFEEKLYQDAGVPVRWVGHPLMDQPSPNMNREALMRRFGLNPWRMTVGLLPGSRASEIKHHLPLLGKAAQALTYQMPGLQWLVPKAPGIPNSALAALSSNRAIDVKIVEGSMAEALSLMAGAFITSGTATLEAAKAGVPMVVIYRTSWPTYLAAKVVMRIPHIAMVNVVAGHEVIPELIQHRAQPRAVASALQPFLQNDERAKSAKASLRAVVKALGPPGGIERAADAIGERLQRGRV